MQHLKKLWKDNKHHLKTCIEGYVCRDIGVMPQGHNCMYFVFVNEKSSIARMFRMFIQSCGLNKFSDFIAIFHFVIMLRRSSIVSSLVNLENEHIASHQVFIIILLFFPSLI